MPRRSRPLSTAGTSAVGAGGAGYLLPRLGIWHTKDRSTVTTSRNWRERSPRVALAPGPVVLHVHTEKGRGYAPAESDDEKRLHDIGPFDPATGVAHVRGRTSSYTEGFGSALVREAALHPELMAITAAMPGSCGLIEFSRRYPERFIDVGIAEQHAVATAAGLAMGGFRPVVAIYSTFLNRAWDQLYYDVGLHGLPVIFCIDRAGITGDDGPSHNGVMDLALLTKVPGMTVLAPSSYEEIPVMLAQAIAITTGPVALRWPKTEARHSARTGNGLSARRVRAGRTVCFLGLGKMVEVCEQAAVELSRHGVEATVWDIRAAAPLDPLMLAMRFVITWSSPSRTGSLPVVSVQSIAHRPARHDPNPIHLRPSFRADFPSHTFRRERRTTSWPVSVSMVRAWPRGRLGCAHPRGNI